VKIADDGEILCKGPNVMMGYYNQPELTREAIDQDGWFHTGDIGVMVDNHYLKITDRKKEMFKLSSGKYIAPQVIENRLKESFFVEQAMVVGENEKFASALVSPNFPYLHEWASRQDIKFRDNEDLIAMREVVDRYHGINKKAFEDFGKGKLILLWRDSCLDYVKKDILKNKRKSKITLINKKANIKEMFENSECTVIPYTSKLQSPDYPLSAIESLMFKKPVICSDVTEMSDIIAEEGCGVVFEPDAEGLKKAFEESKK